MNHTFNVIKKTMNININKKSKHYLLAQCIVKQYQKAYGIPEEDMILLIKNLARQILRSMNKNEFILVRVPSDEPKKKKK